MKSYQLSEQLESNATRRSVIKTGVKLGYAVPLVAASFKLSASGALAVTCLPDFFLIPELDDCCKCDGVLADIPPIFEGGKAVCKDLEVTLDAICGGVSNVSPPTR